MKLSGTDGNHTGQATGNIRLAISIVSPSRHGAIAPQSQGVQVSARYRKEIKMTIDSSNVAWVAKQFPHQVGGTANQVVIDVSVPKIPAADTARILATSSAGRVTVGRLLEYYRALPDLQRPSLDTPETVRQTIDVILLEPYYERTAREMGLKKVLVTHAEFPSQSLTGDEQRDLADMGALIEHCFTTYYTNKAPWETAFANIRKSGVARSVISTDLGQTINPPVAEGFAMFAQRFLDAGFSADEVRTMAVVNPTRLVEE